MDWKPEASVQLLKQGTDASARPVWIMPVMSGTAACFDPLLKTLPSTSRTMYGVLDPYLSGNDAALRLPYFENIKLMVDAMMTKQPTGPFTLVGYSQGVTWIWAVCEVLIKECGQEVDEILGLDPNFPNWNNFDKVADYDGPQMAYGTGAPFCILRMVIPSIMASLVMDWSTEAKREVNVANLLKKAETNVNDTENMIISTELDTGVEVHATPMDFLKSLPADTTPAAATAELIASKFEGFDVSFIQKVLHIRAVCPVRAGVHGAESAARARAPSCATHAFPRFLYEQFRWCCRRALKSRSSGRTART